MTWPKIISISIGCIGLWFQVETRVLAQTMTDNQPTDINPPAASVNQILLPPADDVPEEILRTEIIFEARSPMDGSLISPAEYAQLQTELAAPQTTLTLNSNIRYIIFLLQARRAFKPVIPFLP